MKTAARSQNGTKSSGGSKASFGLMVGGASDAVFAQSGPEAGDISLVPRNSSSAKPMLGRASVSDSKPLVSGIGPEGLLSFGVGSGRLRESMLWGGSRGFEAGTAAGFAKPRYSTTRA